MIKACSDIRASHLLLAAGELAFVLFRSPDSWKSGRMPPGLAMQELVSSTRTILSHQCRGSPLLEVFPSLSILWHVAHEGSQRSGGTLVQHKPLELVKENSGNREDVAIS